MTDTVSRFFKGNESQAKTISDQHDIQSMFDMNGEYYYMLNSISFVSSQELDDEDLEDEYYSANEKVNKISKFLLDIGLGEISSKDYKAAEKDFKDSKNKTFLSNFSPEEKFVYDEIKKFINNSDFELGSQKSFVTSLRSLILKDDEVSMYSIDDFAQRTKKNLDDIFDVGQQSLISDFAAELQKRVKEEFKPKQKMKI